MVEIATNPFGYRVHAGAVLKRCAPVKNQATPTRYYISDHNFKLDILFAYGSVIRTRIHTWSEPAFRNQLLQ